jgi:aminopeptidase-like protein
VLDWRVPDEWTLREAWIADGTGRRIVDLAASNLHVVGYSEPVRRTMSRAELDAHLHSRPDLPDVVPYRTAYHAHTWGFCLTEQQRAALIDGDYDVCIDAVRAPGSLTYGEALLPGSSTDEVLVTTHTCHPSLANDNCSGIAVLTEIARRLAARPRRFTYRLLFAPATIGAITWLATHREVVPRIRHGLVLAGLGDRGALHYKRSRRGATPVDRAAAIVLRDLDGRCIDFSPYGYDERQYCSPGFDLAVGRLSRSLHGEYPEYHTSADNLSFIDASQLVASADAVESILDVLEADVRYVNLAPYGEPQLGRRGLYSAVGGAIDARSVEMALLWVLNQSDGTRSLLDIAERSGLPFPAVQRAAEALAHADLLAPAGDADSSVPS